MAKKKPGITEQRQGLLDAAEEGIRSAQNALQELFDDLDERRANLEASFSGTERYGRFEEACTALEELIGTLDGLELGIELP